MGFDVDDANRSDESILYNVVLAVNKIRKRSLGKARESWDLRINSDFVSTFIVPVTYRDAPDGSVTEWDALYFDLPTSVYSLSHDAGVSFIRYLRNEIPCGCPPAVARNPFTGTTLSSVHALRNSAYQAPKPSTPYFARATEVVNGVSKDRVYLFGPPCDTKHLLVGLVAAPSYETVNPDDQIPLPPEHMADLKPMLLAMEAWLLQIPQERLRNDGRWGEPGEVTRAESPTSVNSPLSLPEDSNQ